MAEYIDKNKACARREHNKEICLICQDRFGYRVNNLPTAEVVERSKIDKAIEEIKKQIDCRSDYCLGLRKSLEILQRNIGE